MATNEAILTSDERKFAEAFLTFVRTVKSEETMAEVRSLLAKQDIQGALALVNQHLGIIGAVSNDVFTSSAKFEAENLIRDEVSRYRAVSGLAMDVFDPAAASVARALTTDLIQDLTLKQEQSIIEAVQSGWRLGMNTNQVASRFRESLGLTMAQNQYVENYRNQLRTGSKSALDRSLRDRRFDRSTEAAISGKPLTEEQIDRMVFAYRRKFITHRARTIALNETTAIVSAARDVAVRQIIGKTNISPDQVIKTWGTKMDGKERETHGALNGQRRYLNLPFQTFTGALLQRPHDPQASAEEVIGCRCGCAYSIVIN